MSLCSIEGCESPVLARGWCRMHYLRWHRHGDPTILKRPKVSPNKMPRSAKPARVANCVICGDKAYGRGWCHRHYLSGRRLGDPLAARPRVVLPVGTRFWSQVDYSDPDGCWPWTGTHHTAGYGHIQRDGQKYLSHRLAFWMAYGTWPEQVCHHCDNPPCVRPDHLFAGNNALNQADMRAKGRDSPPPHFQGSAVGTVPRPRRSVWCVTPDRLQGGKAVDVGRTSRDSSRASATH